jgi:PAS domain S-box-containing protein
MVVEFIERRGAHGAGFAGCREASARADGPEPPVRGSSTARRRLNPTKLAYLIAPVAFAVILLLMRFGYVAREHWWVWLSVFVAIVVVNLQVDRLYRARPNWVTLNLRVASQVVAVTVTIYLTGWGPVLWAAYLFIALENMARAGSRVWRSAVICSIIGMAAGQFALVQGWFPSELRRSEAASLTVMGAFVLFFVIRMAGVIMEQNETALAQKEEAETTLRLSEDRFRSLIQNSSDVTMILGEKGVFRYVSPAIKDLLQYEPEELVGRLATDFVQRDDLDTVLKMLGSDEFQEESGTATLEFRMLRRDGTSRDVEAVVSNQTDRPSVAGYVSNIRDITERKKFEALLAHRALHDPADGAGQPPADPGPGRADAGAGPAVGRPGGRTLHRPRQLQGLQRLAGPRAGDKLLQMVAGRLLGILRSGDTVGRLGGDEFVMLAEGVSFARGPEMIAERVHEVLKPAFHLPGVDNMSITVSASIGIAVGDRPSAEDLLRDADIALYRAKGAGRDQSVLFERSMQSAAVERLTLKSDLESALENNEFFLLYHPFFDLE